MKPAGRNHFTLEWVWFLTWALGSSLWCVTAAS